MVDPHRIPVLTLICGALLLGPVVVACDDQGPAEQIGEKIDDTVEKAGDRIEKATDK
jgi:hypothetical protein